MAAPTLLDPISLLRRLADGHFHSGQQLADDFGVSRMAISKRIRELCDNFGLQVDSVTGKGYRLADAIELLDESAIREGLDADVRNTLHALAVLPSVDSTSSHLSRQPLPAGGAVSVCMAEYQTAGRGRRGRQWVSPFGRNLYFSLAREFSLPMSELSGLSLAVGVALAQVLEEAGVKGIALKWPNDLHWRGRKLAGILMEVSGEPAGPVQAVVGIGFNLGLTDADRAQIDQPSVSLRDIPGGAALNRNALATALLQRLIRMFRQFESEGVDALLPHWERFDVYLGQPVELIEGPRVTDGIYRGIEADGALRLETGDGRIQLVHAGEISLRPINRPTD